MEETIIINVIENKDPLSLSLIMEPVINEFKYIGLGILPAGDLDSVCNFPITLLETGCVARVDPENPRLGRSISDSVRVFDGKLRLSSKKSAVDNPQTILDSPDATQADKRYSRCRCGALLVNLIK
jgi:hypothetical protein